MTKFNKTGVRTAPGKSPVRPTTRHGQPTARTALGGAGYTFDAKGELFRLAVANFVGEDTFHEAAGDRDARYNTLVRQVAVEDPQWTLEFLGWLRNDANMRSASITGAIEAVKGRLDAGVPSVPAYELPGQSTDRGVERATVGAVLQRADEPGEALAYFLANYGRKVPKPIKRGIADGATRLYNEYSLMKYDTPSHGVRFADVIDLTHPAPATPEQGELFKYALDRRHNRDTMIHDSLAMITANDRLRDAAEENPSLLLDAVGLRKAGMTWENVLSIGGSHIDKRALWEALAPNMGYMALLRNLRNMDEAGVSDEVAEAILARLTDPELVTRSRQLPYRFYSAYEAAPSDRWKHGLSKALDLALGNIPALGGKNLVLIDTSQSMTTTRMSEKSSRTVAEVAALFGVALAKRSGAELHGFANGQFRHRISKGQSTLAAAQAFTRRTGEVGHGTELHAAVRATLKGHDRVFVISDEQTVDSDRGHLYGRGAESKDFGAAQVFAFNLGGYKSSTFGAAPNVHHLGGLTDATFRMIPLLERGNDAPWPWQETDTDV